MKLSKYFLLTVIVITSLLVLFTHAQNTQQASQEFNPKTVKIGDQVWMAENLKVTHYRNGDPIPHVTSNSEWEDLSTGAYCAYDNDSSNARIYGYLYNWYAVNDSRNIAPEGWHVPSDDEWQKLVNFLGGREYAGAKLKSSYGWSNNGNGSNSSSFSALPGGFRSYRDGTFSFVRNNAYFWSATGYVTNYAWYWRLYYDISEVSRLYHRKQLGFSIRLVKD